MNANGCCIAHLEAGGLLLVPELRQARILRRLHDRAQVAAGKPVWPTAQVLPLEAWLAEQWRQASAARPELPAVLAPVALRWLWRREIAAGTEALLDPADLAARARGSWLRLRAHGGDLAAVRRWPLTRDQQAFAGWAQAIELELRQRHGCDPGELTRLCTEHRVLAAGGPPILLAGFRRQTAAESQLFTELAATGRKVETLAPAPARGGCYRHRAPDPDGERDAMLTWLRERLTQVPDGVHALIVPEMDAQRGALERALAAALEPGLELPAADRGQRAFDLAGGYPLVAQPVADAALVALAAAVGPVSWAEASRLLLGAYIAGAEAERGPRIAADLALRESPVLRIRSARLAELAGQSGATSFAQAAMAAGAALDGQKRRAAGAWAEAYGAALAAWGWPGEATLGSREYQAARHFRELLHELAALAAVAGPMTAAETLGELHRLAVTPFQPESGEPAVFVLDSFEDPGVHLDSLWVAGLTATVWPRPAAVDPLLPIELQRALGMPAVTPEGAVAEARAIVGRWRAQSDALVLSWPEIENDTGVDCTPLLPADAAELALPLAPPTRERLAFASARIETIPERPLPALAAARGKGGARLLELQAQCPFRACAEFRLGAAPLAEPQAGFDRRLRGIVLHRALHELWGAIGDQAALVALGEPARSRHIAAAVDAALDTLAPAGTGPVTLALERAWQRQAAARLLALDLERPPFAVVETEQALALAIGGLELSLRVDRVDRIGEELVVIDYKTGRTQSNAWRGARMDAPQLPLYAVLHPGGPTGIAFAAADAGRARYVGIARADGIIPGLKPAEKFALTEERESGFDWPAVTARWFAWLERLARGIVAGECEVDPKLGAETCRSCHLAALCRVEPASPADVEVEGSGGE